MDLHVTFIRFLGERN